MGVPGIRWFVVERTLAAVGTLMLGVALAIPGGTSVQGAGVVPSPSPGPSVEPLQRILVAATTTDLGSDPSTLQALATRLGLADPAATTIVLQASDPDRMVGPFHVTVGPRTTTDPSEADPSVSWLGIAAGASPPLLTQTSPAPSDRPAAAAVTVVEALGDGGGIVAHRSGRLVLTPDELRLPTWRLPGTGEDAVALDGAWWTLGPTRTTMGTLTAESTDDLRARLADHPPSAMRRLVDVSVGDVTDDGTPDIALAFRRAFRRTLLNASRPRRAWTDAHGLSAHVGLYRSGDLSEVWVAGTLTRPVRRLAACTGALAVAYSTLRRSRITATSAWRWQGFAFLPLPELTGRGTPICIDIDRDGRTEAAIIERS